MTECLDASVVVKWFRDDEPKTKEAQGLYNRISDLKSLFVASEWLVLEVVRAFVKAGMRKSCIEEHIQVLDQLSTLGAIKLIPVTNTIPLARELEIELGLHAADAVHLATAISTKSAIFWTEDEHLHKNKVKDYAKGHNLEIQKLK
ncbi:MAG: type II toxin-antitoxin system VapC family toxin [Candidatus Altiarchaeota archaeon]